MLIKSPTNKARNANIKTEIEAGRDHKQAEAIGYSEQRKAKRKSPTLDEVKKARRRG